LRHLILLLILILIISCSTSDSNSSQAEPGEIPVRLSLSPIMEYCEVTRVCVTISEGDFSQSIDLEIAGTIATGTFTGLTPGFYTIYVQIYDNETLIATGYGSGEVLPGQTTLVNIDIEPVPGTLIIEVDWENVLNVPDRILLLGNSHTYFNGGVDVHLRGLVHAADSTFNLTIERIAPGGCFLEGHYSNPNTILEIQNGDWDLVFLQEQSRRPVEEPELFYEYATLLDEVITSSGAETGFYMTWGWENYHSMIDTVAAAYNYISQELGASVAPVGLAWERVLDENPEIDLYADDGYHPSIYGTYLASCVFYVTIWHQNPMGLDYTANEQVEPEICIILQEAAWKSVVEYQAGIITPVR